jgi:uncharacterized protein (TIGR01244 family)
MMLERIYNFIQLSEEIATSGQPTAEQLKNIAQAGFEIVINLGLTGTDYALADEEGWVRQLGMSYIHVPVLWEAPTRENLEAFFSVLEEHKSKRIFVHCAANMRVSVFMALYRILRLGWTCERAFEDVRKIWEPDGQWSAFIEDILGQGGYH